MKTYATLGGVKFELATIEGLSETMAWEYKQQETVADTAAIQFAGAKARTLEIKAKLMAAFCEPEDRIDELKEKAKKIAPLPLILANGRLLGYFVINDISTTWTKTDYKGNIIACDISLKLTEGDTKASQAAASADAAKAASKVAAAGKKAAKKGQSDNPLQAIRQVVEEKQQKLVGRVPSVNEALRRVTP